MAVGQEMFELIERLYPICRSITGDGVRESLRIIGELIPLEIREVPSGTQVFDWTVPPEWNVREAWIRDPGGEKVVDFRSHNLHLVSYSVPVHRRLQLRELDLHLHSLPDRPDWIPYRTSYYTENWGFCLSQHQRDMLLEGEYEVYIDSTLAPGALSYGEFTLPGNLSDEILISCHICHPSLCNDNLSGNAVSVFLANHLREKERRYSYRFLFIPGTIGSICWLALNRESSKRIRHGLSLTCLGDSSNLTYKRTVFGAAEIDRVAALALAEVGEPFEEIDFFPYGYDERQFNSPGFRLPVGSLMRGRHGKFPEYHTSADNLEFIDAKQLERSLAACCSIVEVLEGNLRYRNLAPFGEPQLGKRGIYDSLSRESENQDLQYAMLWVLNLSDGEHSLLDIAERSQMKFRLVAAAAELLERHQLLEEI